MNHHESNALVYSVIGVCGLMAVFNALRIRTRGWAGAFLPVAFLVFGALAYAYLENSPQIYIQLGTLILMLLLVADFFFRVGTQKRK